MMSMCKSSMETILTVSMVYSSFLPFTLYFYYSVIESPLVNALYCVYAPHYFRFINKAMSQRCLFTRSFSLSSFTTIFVSFFCFLFSTSLLVGSLIRESCQPLSLNGSLVREPRSQEEYYIMYGSKRPIYLFSLLTEDKSLTCKHIKRIRLDDKFINIDLTLDDLKRSLLIFDDIDTIKNKAIKTKLNHIIDTVLAMLDDMLRYL